MRRGGGGASLQRALTIENQDIQCYGRRPQRRRGGHPGFFSNDRAKIDSVAIGQLEGMGDGVGAANGVSEFPIATCLPCQRRQRIEIGKTFFGVHVEHPLGELRHLGDATSNRYPFDRVAAQIFQHAADEIPHVDQRGLGQFIQRLSRFFRGVPGSAEHVSAAGRTRHVNASPDGVDPGRAGKRDNDARGAENGDTSENAESAVEGFFRKFLAVPNGNFNFEISLRTSHLVNGGFDHLAWHGIDGGFSWRQGQSGPRDGADAHAGLKGDTASRLTAPHRAFDQRAVGNIRVIACILDDTCAGEVFTLFLGREGKCGLRAAWKFDLDRVRKLAGEKGGAGRLRGGCRAGARGPAAAKGLSIRFHMNSYSRDGFFRHR